MATVKFPSEMSPATSIGGNDKLMISKESTGEAYQATFNQAKDYLAITSIELEPLVGGTTSGTALVVPNGPAGEQRTAEVASGLWYNFGSGAIQTGTNKRWKAYWNGSSWSLKDMGALPSVTVSDDVEGNTGAVSGVGVENYTLPKDIDDRVTAALKSDNNDLWIWAVDDKTYIAGLAKESIPFETVAQKSDAFDGVAMGDENGNIIMVNPNGSGDVSPAYDKLSPSDLLEYYTQPQSVSKDGIWNQWIHPVAAVDKDGNTWNTGVGSDSQLYVTKFYKDGRTVRVKIGDIISNLGSFKSDDHNAPAILLDSREDAISPIMFFQVDHNTTKMRMWKFSTLAIEEWGDFSYQEITSVNFAYCQTHRFGDEIFIFARTASTSGRPWSIIYSSDNGVTWVHNEIFITNEDLSTHPWMYMLTKGKEDGSGIHIMSYGHPLNSNNQNIYYLSLDFVSGQVINPATGVVLADIRSAINTPSFVPIKPFDVGLQFYTASPGEINRMWDFKEDNSTISLILCAHPIPTPNKTGFESTVYRVANFNKEDGVVNFVQDLSKAGYTISEDPGEYAYTAGACLLSPYRAITCQWTPKSISDGGLDPFDPRGEATVRSVDFDGTNKTEKVQWVSKLKVIRPYLVLDGESISFSECLYFKSYADFYSTILNIKTRTIKF